MLRTVGTAVENAVYLHAVADDPAATVGTKRRERFDGTLETVEEMTAAVADDLDALVVLIATGFTPVHRRSRENVEGILIGAGYAVYQVGPITGIGECPSAIGEEIPKEKPRAGWRGVGEF